MASTKTTTYKVLNITLLSSVFLVSMTALSVSSHQFQVGGERGWVIPPHNLTIRYNDWAAHHRFHMGDTLSFRYQNDSVLVVDSRGYQDCITSKPIAKFEDGNTVFKFDRCGFFYFISGQQSHCELGQKLITRVMSPSKTEPPQSAPSGGDDGSDSEGQGSHSPPGNKSVAKLSTVASYFTTAFGGSLCNSLFVHLGSRMQELAVVVC